MQFRKNGIISPSTPYSSLGWKVGMSMNKSLYLDPCFPLFVTSFPGHTHHTSFVESAATWLFLILISPFYPCLSRVFVLLLVNSQALFESSLSPSPCLDAIPHVPAHPMLDGKLLLFKFLLLFCIYKSLIQWVFYNFSAT